MILIINVCKEKLHYLEFVKPVEDILKSNNIDFITRNYLEVGDDILEKADKVIICGTSLKDNDFIKHLESFSWIKEFNKSILGICAGMQIIAGVFEFKLKKNPEIGFFKEIFDKDFLGLSGEQEVYHLHNYYSEFSDDFEVYCKNQKIIQAVKHKQKEIYGVLFHPEVRQKNMILEFAR
jgi:GMP synthase (glutamine-hydrolysing)